MDKISPKLTLKNVLYVPKLFANLLSVSELSYDVNCKVNFLLPCCLFQDQDSGMMIGCAKEWEGLSHLEKFEKPTVGKWTQPFNPCF